MSINGKIDFRSDTVTIPTPAMREAMATAAVGDDVFSDDPTVNRLQEMAAERMGMQAGLLVSSGTMGNLVSMMAHCQRGDEIIIGTHSHIFGHEAGGSAVVGGIHSCQLPNQPDGTLDIGQIEDAIREDDEHCPVTRVIALENTQNAMGGVCLTPDYIRQVAELAHRRGIKLHIDGARIFNAAVALKVPVSELTRHADSVTFCLSKGLSAPIGSVICGSKQFIQLARRRRKVVGGGMRQAGILAAAGIVALEQMVDRLAIDHVNARALAIVIAAIPGLTVNMSSVQTNMVYFGLSKDLPFDAETLCQRAEKQRVRMLSAGPRTIRAVTHCWVEEAEIKEALDVIAHVVRA